MTEEAMVCPCAKVLALRTHAGADDSTPQEGEERHPGGFLAALQVIKLGLGQEHACPSGTPVCHRLQELPSLGQALSISMLRRSFALATDRRPAMLRER